MDQRSFVEHCPWISSFSYMSDGRIFTIGESWSGGYDGEDGEIYNTASNKRTLLPECPFAPMLINYARGIFRQDNHGGLFGWEN
jgi:galactose oxidase